MSLLQKNLIFKLEGTSYEVKFPNVGQVIDMENMKMSLTNGGYVEMLRSGLKTSYFVIDLVDSVSFLYILVPSLREDLNVRDYNELDPFMAKKIVKVYKSQIKPWFDGLMDELLSDDDIEQPLPEPEKAKSQDEKDFEEVDIDTVGQDIKMD